MKHFFLPLKQNNHEMNESKRQVQNHAVSIPRDVETLGTRGGMCPDNIGHPCVDMLVPIDL